MLTTYNNDVLGKTERNVGFMHDQCSSELTNVCPDAQHFWSVVSFVYIGKMSDLKLRDGNSRIKQPSYPLLLFSYIGVTVRVVSNCLLGAAPFLQYPVRLGDERENNVQIL